MACGYNIPREDLHVSEIIAPRNCSIFRDAISPSPVCPRLADLSMLIIIHHVRVSPRSKNTAAVSRRRARPRRGPHRAPPSHAPATAILVPSAGTTCVPGAWMADDSAA